MYIYIYPIVLDVLYCYSIFSKAGAEVFPAEGHGLRALVERHGQARRAELEFFGLRMHETYGEAIRRSPPTSAAKL